MGVGETVRLGMDRGPHVGMRMAEAGDRRPARGVDVGLAVHVEELDALAAHGDGWGRMEYWLEQASL